MVPVRPGAGVSTASVEINGTAWWPSSAEDGHHRDPTWLSGVQGSSSQRCQGLVRFLGVDNRAVVGGWFLVDHDVLL